jgi:hypothetical protein
MGHAFIERLSARVVGEAQDLTTPDAGQAAGSGDQQEAQGAHAAEGIRVGALAGTWLGRRERLQLEAPQQVVGEDAEVLPGTVRAVVVGRHHVEGELALQLAVGLLLGPAARDEGPEGRRRERLVGRDGRVLEVPVIGREQVELEVLPRLVADLLPIDDHAEGQVPGLQPQLGFEGADLPVDPGPVSLRERPAA